MTETLAYIALAAYLIAGYLDARSTDLGLASGKLAEGNPVGRLILRKLGVTGLYLMHVVLVFALVLYLTITKDYLYTAITGFAGAGYFGYAARRNYKLLKSL